MWSDSFKIHSCKVRWLGGWLWGGGRGVRTSAELTVVLSVATRGRHAQCRPLLEIPAQSCPSEWQLRLGPDFSEDSTVAG